MQPAKINPEFGGFPAYPYDNEEDKERNLCWMADMSSSNMTFLDDGQSIASTVSQLHHYFKTSYSRHKIKRSDLVSRLEAAEPDEVTTIQTQLRELDETLALFGILADSLSIANRVLHTEAATQAIGVTSELYAIHIEDEYEQAIEHELALRRVANQKEPTGNP